MKWRMGRRSSNIEDLRGSGGGGGLPGLGRGGGLGGLGGGLGGLGTRRGAGRAAGGGGLGLIAIVVIMLLLGVDPSVLLQGGGIGGAPFETTQGAGQSGGQSGGQTAGLGSSGRALDPRQDELKDFVSVVLADTEDVWGELFAASGRRYEQPRLVLFSGAVRSACGFAEGAMGPFYCPGDRKVYIDLEFFDELDRRFGAPGDFAQAYVIAHEVGHHVQNLLGVLADSHERKAQLGRGSARANAVSVAVELQADCYAGVWAHHAQRARAVLEPGDIEEALGAASAVGDDRIQRRAQGRVVPDSFTHGSSQDRMRWFKVGFDKGEARACNSYPG